MRSRTVDRSALTISQNTRRQVQHKPKQAMDSFRTQRVRENPQVLGLALSVHHDTRNKKLVHLLHAQNYCVSYGRSLLLETSIANAVVENTREFNAYMYHRSSRKVPLSSLLLTTLILRRTQPMGKEPRMGQSLQYIKRPMLLENTSHPAWNLARRRTYWFFHIMFPSSHAANQNLDHTVE